MGHKKILIFNLRSRNNKIWGSLLYTKLFYHIFLKCLFYLKTEHDVFILAESLADSYEKIDFMKWQNARCNLESATEIAKQLQRNSKSVFICSKLTINLHVPKDSFQHVRLSYHL